MSSPVPTRSTNSLASQGISAPSRSATLRLRAPVRRADISSPGWVKHAWSSFFAPWIAEATIQFCSTRFGASRFLTTLRRADVTSLCAPSTVWRTLVQADSGAKPAALREVVGPGSPVKRG